MPLLIDVVADEAAADRHVACRLLSVVAIGDQGTWLADPSAYGREVARKVDLTVEDLERELAEWVEAASNESKRVVGN